MISLPIEINDMIKTYLNFIDCLKFRHVCKKYSMLQQNSISNQLATKINEKFQMSSSSQFGFELLNLIKKYKKLSIGGSTIIEVINGDKFENSDVDIYIENIDGMSNRKLMETVEYKDLDDLLEKYNCITGYTFHETYTMEGFLVQEVQVNEGYTLEIVNCRYDPEFRVKELGDLNFCNNYYDGNTFYVENINSIIEKKGVQNYRVKYNEKIMNDIGYPVIITWLNRISKYYKRGYTILVEIKLLYALCDSQCRNLTHLNIEHMTSNYIKFTEDKKYIKCSYGTLHCDGYEVTTITLKISEKYPNYAEYSEIIPKTVIQGLDKDYLD